MKQILFLIILFEFFCCNFIYSKDILTEKNYTEIEVRDGGTVIGNVKYMGVPAAVGKNLYRDWELSDASKTASEKLILSKIHNSVKNAVVSLKDITQGKKKIIPAIRPIIDQQNDCFIPHAIAIVSGTTVDILNGDEQMHNVHTRSTRNQPFNLGTTYKQRISKRFDYPEIIKVTCDLHKHAYAWIVVIEHPYFDMTDRNGYFEICDIPPGTHKFQVWHEELENIEKDVTIHPKEITTIDFIYSQH